MKIPNGLGIICMCVCSVCDTYFLDFRLGALHQFQVDTWFLQFNRLQYQLQRKRNVLIIYTQVDYTRNHGIYECVQLIITIFFFFIFFLQSLSRTILFKTSMRVMKLCTCVSYRVKERTPDNKTYTNSKFKLAKKRYRGALSRSNFDVDLMV